jgi:hypothetical protein
VISSIDDDAAVRLKAMFSSSLLCTAWAAGKKSKSSSMRISSTPPPVNNRSARAAGDGAHSLTAGQGYYPPGNPALPGGSCKGSPTGTKELRKARPSMRCRRRRLKTSLLTEMMPGLIAVDIAKFQASHRVVSFLLRLLHLANQASAHPLTIPNFTAAYHHPPRKLQSRFQRLKKTLGVSQRITDAQSQQRQW